MKNARDYLDYMKDHPEEREFLRTMAPAKLQKHVKGLGFEFTPDELQCEMELELELTEDELAAASGGDWCDGHCGATCEGNDPENNIVCDS